MALLRGDRRFGASVHALCKTIHGVAERQSRDGASSESRTRNLLGD
jgi:hypothetical protein